MKNKPQFILFVGASGAGKTYIENHYLSQDEGLKRLISFTTRPKRPNEIDGIDYNFINKEDMKDLDIIQQMQIYGNYYGTCKDDLKDGYNYSVVVGVDGPQQFRDIFDKSRVHVIYVKAPWYKRIYRLIKRDGFKKGLKRFIQDIGRFTEFEDQTKATVINN